jgi:hypothetical protein
MEGVDMRLQEDTHTTARELATLPEEQAAVAELMEPSERLVGDAPLYTPPASQLLLIL